jgi:hypothetical protein
MFPLNHENKVVELPQKESTVVSERLDSLARSLDQMTVSSYESLLKQLDPAKLKMKKKFMAELVQWAHKRVG